MSNYRVIWYSISSEVILKGAMIMKKWTWLLVCILLIGSLAACGGPKKEVSKKQDQKETLPLSKKDFLMGTVVSLKIYNAGKQDAMDASYKKIRELAAEITTNDDGKNSEIDKINANSGKKPVKVTKNMFFLIERAIFYSKNSDGGFDLAIGPLTNLWRIGFPDARKPSQAEIDNRLPLVNYKDVQLNEANQTVYLKRKGMALDLGAIAKGYIADEVAKVMKAHGVNSAIVDLGGNIFVIGHNPDGKKWNVGIQDPFSPRGSIIGKLETEEMSIVTSGIYERHLEVDGKDYHHLLDPKTGYPFDNNIAGVSIISKKSIDGDGLSTVTFSKGIQGGLAYLKQFKGVEAVFVSRDKKVYITPGLKGKFELVNTDDFKMGN